MSKRRGSDIGADWKLLVLDSKSGVQHVVNVCNPEKLSVLGLKNLVHEKTDIPPEQMILYLIKKHKNQTAANDRMELGETLDSKDDVAFLRDYPTLQNGSTLHVVHAS